MNFILSIFLFLSTSIGLASQPYIESSSERFQIVEQVRLVARLNDSKNLQEEAEVLAEMIKEKHQSIEEILLLANWIFDDYKFWCSSSAVQATLKAIEQISELEYTQNVKVVCKNWSRDQGIWTLLNIQEI